MFYFPVKHQCLRVLGLWEIFPRKRTKVHAYFHALEVSHHVYVNMETKRVYVLPEGYEVTSQSLDDIKFQVDPHLPKSEVLQIDRTATEARDLEGREYRPGRLLLSLQV